MFRSNTIIQYDVQREESSIIVTLDIGNSCSGYAYASTQDFLEDNWTIQMNNPWSRERHVTNKTSTTLLVEPDQSLNKAKFGYEAESEFAEKFLDGCHHGYMLFRDVKHEFYKVRIDAYQEQKPI